MRRTGLRRSVLVPLVALVAFGISGTGAWRLDAADHGDAPLASKDQPADIGDVYLFLDPNDTSQVVLIMTVNGFIVPPENANLGFFSDQHGYLFAIENTGDAVPDQFIGILFSPQTSRTTPQTASVFFQGNKATFQFTAPTTISETTPDVARDFTVTTDPATGVRFFAGLVDDPFFFDIPAELKYRASRIAGAPNPTFFDRARDSFAGYNILAMALRIPKTLLEVSPTIKLGMSGVTFRITPGNTPILQRLVQIDRMGIPAVNTVFIPFSRKDEYNRSSTTDDAAGKFQANVVTSLTQLQTDQTSIGILAGLAVANGDFLRLDTTIPNVGPGGGTNSAAAFPNGRRLGDDVIDTIVTLINNRAQVNPGTDQVDRVNANDKPLTDTFPFLAKATQPFPQNTTDDRTRN